MEAITIEENEPFLRQISKEVTFPDRELEDNINVLKEFCLTHNGVFAMAAVQLGIAKRIVYINSTSSDCKVSKNPFVLINPVILEQKGKTEFWEACFSGMLNFALVERPYSMRVRYQDEKGKTHEKTFEGFVCTVISHELDHLDGIFHMDRAKELMQMGSEERKLWRIDHKYKVYSKDCDFVYSPLDNKRNKN